jgi:hypothetical protein
VYWGGASDVTGAPDTLKAFSFNAGGSGLLSTRPTSQSAKSFNFSAPIPTISANGSAGGILWAVDNSSAEGTCKSGANCQVLYAYDATNLATLLYTSNQAANHRDVPGSAVKFATPSSPTARCTWRANRILPFMAFWVRCCRRRSRTRCPPLAVAIACTQQSRHRAAVHHAGAVAAHGARQGPAR